MFMDIRRDWLLIRPYGCARRVARSGKAGLTEKERTMKRAGLLAVLVALAMGVHTDAQAEGLDLFHFQLNKSAPEAETTVSAPSEVRLWFSQVPQEGTTSIRVLDPAGEPIHTADVVQAADEDTAFSVALHGTLAPGEYTVAWRAMGQDGHVVRGDFPFTVAAP